MEEYAYGQRGITPYALRQGRKSCRSQEKPQCLFRIRAMMLGLEWILERQDGKIPR